MTIYDQLHASAAHSKGIDESCLICNPLATIAQRANLKRLLDEQVVIEKLVDTLLAANCTLSVNDGEETTVTKSTDRTEILAALRTTDEDKIFVHRPEGSTGNRIGGIFLVYGNDPWEVVNDYSTSLEDILKPYEEFTDAMANAHYASDEYLIANGSTRASR